MQQFTKTKLVCALALSFATFGCNKTSTEPKLPVAKPAVQITADRLGHVENSKAQLKAIDSISAPILEGAREFIETRASFQDLNGSITGMKVLATYTCSGANEFSDGSSRDIIREHSLCGVTTKDKNSEQFVILNMLNVNGTWTPMFGDSGNKKRRSLYSIFHSKTRPTIAEIVEQTGFPENRSKNGTNWYVDNQILFQENWEKYITGNPPKGFIASNAAGG